MDSSIRSGSLYLLLCLLYALSLKTGVPVLVKVAKVLPILLLLALTIRAYAVTSEKRLVVSALALFFSAVGDVSWSFVSLMAFFAVAQICYAVSFSRQFRIHSVWQAVLLVVLTAIVSITCVVVLRHMTADGCETGLMIGCLVYLLLLTAMSFFAICQLRPCWALFAVGSLLFVVSDCTIALGRYAWDVPCRTLLVMGTYYAAQLMLNIKNFSKL